MCRRLRIEYDVQQQTADMPYASGYLYIVVMSFDPGEPVSLIRDRGELERRDVEIMRQQVAETWE